MEEKMVLGEEFRLQLERLESYNSCFFIPLTDRSHDRSTRGMHDPDWLEVVGNPTIPHVQSLRQPPANVALPATASNEQLIGVTSRNASRRYLRKLQKDRERNQEVLTECMGNLPIVIRQLAYPESPPNKTSARNGVGNVVHSADKKFRIGRLKDDFWQENVERWTNEDIETESSPPRGMRRTGSCEKQKQNGAQNGAQNGRQVDDDSAFVRHAGFVGVPNQTSTLKYRFGQKKAKLTSESAEGPPKTRSTFRPKGFGALYDELEFERRYKKVFDLNKHIHFVHSNFITGQRISKRAKLPPIGHNPSAFSDPTDGGDIFAIMSVQKYNYPDEDDPPHNSLHHSSPSFRGKSDGSPRRQHAKRHIVEIPKEVDGPFGFVPGAIPKTGQSPFDGVHGVTHTEQSESELQLPLWIREARAEESEGTQQTERSARSMPSIPLRFKAQDSNKSTGRDDSKSRSRSRSRDGSKNSRPAKKKSTLRKQEATPDNKSDDEGEPFNISVHVNLRPRDPIANHDSDFHARHRVYPGILEDTPKHNANVFNDSPGRDKSNARTWEREPRITRTVRKLDDSDSDTFEEKVLYPTRLPSRSEQDSADDLSDMEHSQDHVIWPKNITTTTNQYGIASQKVKYPDRFRLGEALEEEDETAASSHGSPVKMLDGSNKVPKLFADPAPQSETKEDRQAE